MIVYDTMVRLVKSFGLAIEVITLGQGIWAL